MQNLSAFKNKFFVVSFLKLSFCREIKTMKAWQVFRFGKPEDLELSPSLRIPILTNPMDVLIKVHAASINPLDLRMLEGYGNTLFSSMKTVKDLLPTSSTFSLNCGRDVLSNVMRTVKDPPSSSKSLPLILGRDFSGTIVHVGKEVKRFQCGDEVWGVVGPEQNGSHAEYVSVSSCSITNKPSSLSHLQAASFPYASLTAWSALCMFGGLSEKSTNGKKILVTGASGGVGTFAVQLLKSWGAHVIVTCSEDATEMMLNLGADQVIDYHSPDFRSEMMTLKNLDLVFDNVGGDYPALTLNSLKTWRNAKYVTVVSPLLKNTDENGLLFGSLKSAAEAAYDTAMSFKDGRSYRWAYFVPNGRALEVVADLVENNRVIPVIDKTFKFDDLPQAYLKALEGHARGKTVIDFSETDTSVEPENEERPNA